MKRFNRRKILLITGQLATWSSLVLLLTIYGLLFFHEQSVAQTAEPLENSNALLSPGDQKHDVGELIQIQLQMKNPQTEPVQFAALSELPPGLSLDRDSGLISGVAVATGVYQVKLQTVDNLQKSTVDFVWLISVKSTPSIQQTVRLYEDDFADGWTAGSWSDLTHDPANTTAVFEGDHSLSVKYDDPWSVFYLTTEEPLVGSTWQELRFQIYATETDQDILVSIIDSQLRTTGNFRASSVPNQWTDVQIPLNQLGQFDGILYLLFSNAQSEVQTHFYLDNVELNGTSNAATGAITRPQSRDDGPTNELEAATVQQAENFTNGLPFVGLSAPSSKEAENTRAEEFGLPLNVTDQVSTGQVITEQGQDQNNASSKQSGNLKVTPTYFVMQSEGDSDTCQFNIDAEISNNQMICTAVAGQRLKFNAQLRSRDGKPIGNNIVNILLNGKQIRRIRTDEHGRANYSTKNDLPVGTYTLQAVFEGTTQRMPAKAAVKITVEPILLEVEIIPPLAGIHFTLNEQEFISNDDGVAKIIIENAGDYVLELHTEQEDRGNHRIEFARWLRENYELSQTIQLPRNSKIQVGFNIQYRIDQTFVDLDGNATPEERITSHTYLSSHGAIIERTDMDPVWLEANRVTRRRFGLEAVPIQYSLISVMVDGSNVVNRKQQRFYIEEADSVWELTLILYDAQFSAKDALFGFPVGDGINLEYPNGELIFHQADAEGIVSIDSLARGEYKVRAAGINGVALNTPVAITRYQDVALKVISYLDMGLALGIGLIAAVGLLLIGRPWLMNPFAMKKRQQGHSLSY